MMSDLAPSTLVRVGDNVVEATKPNFAVLQHQVWVLLKDQEQSGAVLVTEGH